MTTADLEALNLGYLTGADLVQFCAPQHLISRWNVNNSNLQRGCDYAYSEIIRNLSNRYDVTDELKNTGVIAAKLGTPVISGGAIISIPVTDPGIGYASAPDVLITDANGSGGESVASLSATSLDSIIVTGGGSGYTAPVASLAGGLGVDKRENFLVQLTAVIAIRKILASFEKISAEMKDNFTWAENSLMDIRNGQMPLILPEASKIMASTACIVPARFRTLG